MPRKYKTSYKSRRPSRRFRVDFISPPCGDAPIQPKPFRTCENCKGKVEEVMSGTLCFSCNRERNAKPNAGHAPDCMYLEIQAAANRGDSFPEPEEDSCTCGYSWYISQAQQLPPVITWEQAMTEREQDFNRWYYNNPDGKPEWKY
jgi:hypothetical protein